MPLIYGRSFGFGRRKGILDASLDFIPRLDWGEAPDVSLFFGREAEIATLSQWVVEERCRLVAILGMGGMGKTALTARLIETLAESPACPFQHIVWRSLRHAPTLDELIKDLAEFVPTQPGSRSPKELLRRLRQSRCLLVLDNMETILHERERAGCFRPGYEDYGELLQLVAETRHQSSVVLTSREKPAVVGTFEGEGFSVRSHLLSGSLAAALQLIEAKGLLGSPEEKRQLADDYSSSPLALKIVATSIHNLFDGKISLFLAENTLVFNSLHHLLNQQFERLSDAERTVMYWLAINQTWTSISELVADIQPAVSRAQVIELLESLQWRSLIDTQTGRYTQQPVVMEYVIDRFTSYIAHELESAAFDLLLRYPLIKTTVSDYIRNSQSRLILQPVARQFGQAFSPEATLTQQILRLLAVLRQGEQVTGYGAGNLINLCCQLGVDLTGYDFSRLSIRHPYLANATLHRVNFSHARLTDAVFTQSFSSILSLTYSPDGQMLAAGHSNGGLRVWRLTDYQPLCAVQAHTDWVRAVAFSPDGTYFASSSDDATIRLWDTATGEPRRTLLDHTDYVQAIAFHPQGELASGSHDGTIKLWDISTGSVLQTLASQGALEIIPVRAVAFSPDGRYLASASDNIVKLWNYATGDCVATLEGHRDRIWTLAWHPDSVLLASGSVDKTIRLWDVVQGTCRQTLMGHQYQVLALDFSADGRLLVSSSAGQTIKLWEVASGICVRTLQDHRDWVWALALNQQQLASGGDDQTLKIWDVQTGRCLKTLRGFTNQIFSVDFHPQSPWLVAGSLDGAAHVWHWQTGESLATLPDHDLWVRATQFSPDGKMLATGSTDRTVRLWDLSTLALPRQKGASKLLSGHTASVRALAWCPSSQCLASGSADCTIRIWQANTGQCLQVLSGHTQKVRSVAWNPKRHSLASAGDDQTIRLWDLDTGAQRRVIEGHSKWLLTVAWHPDGVWLASGSADQTVRLWDAGSGELLRVLEGHRSQVQCVVFHPQQPILASASGDSTIRLWNINTGALLQTLVGHTNQVQAVAFSADGQTLASSSNDGTVKLWHCPSIDTTGQGRAGQNAVLDRTNHYFSSLQPERPYEGMIVEGTQGLTTSQGTVLRELGAVDHAPRPPLPPPPPPANLATESPTNSASSAALLTPHEPAATVPSAAKPAVPAADPAITAAPAATLQIQLLGSFILCYQGDAIAGVNERSQALLSYLILHRQSPQSRQQIAYALYPEVSDSQSRTSLRKDIYNLRQVLPAAGQVLHIKAQSIQWSPQTGTGTDIALDVADFEAALDQAAAAASGLDKQRNLEQAVHHYGGELLPLLDYEWVTQERDRLQQRYLQALAELTTVLEQQQQYAPAIRYGQRLLRCDPLRESTYQALIRLYGESGDRATAIQLYHRCRQILQEELGIDPSAETQQLYQTLLD